MHAIRAMRVLQFLAAPQRLCTHAQMQQQNMVIIDEILGSMVYKRCPPDNPRKKQTVWAGW